MPERRLAEVRPYVAHIPEPNPHNPFDNIAVAAIIAGGHSAGEVSADGVDFDRVESILAHAEYVPRGWARCPLATLIRRRIELGIDDNIHDATYWLAEFHVPAEIAGTPMEDLDGEATLLMAAFNSEDPTKLPTKERRVNELFSTDTRAQAYRMLLAGEIQDGQDFQHKVMNGELGFQGGLTQTDMKLKDLLNNAKRYGFIVGKESQAAVLSSLHQMAERRKQYVREAQAWVQTHGTTPREKLVNAWKVRRTALSDGAADNPNAILAWNKVVGISRVLIEMEEQGTLPGNIDQETLDAHPAFIGELLRVHEGETAIKALGNLLEYGDNEARIPSWSMELSDGSRVEVLTKDDPRIFTVGADTRCCMTPTGMARSCVEAAYSDPRVSVMAVYDSENQLMAHSVLFYNPGEGRGTIVIDNIETNEGRDRNTMLKRYREFFGAYMERAEMADFDAVYLGIHGREKYDLPLKAVERIPAIMQYSDARDQKLLYQRDPEFDPIEFVPATKAFQGPYALIEKAVYGSDVDQMPPERHIFASDSIPGTHSYIMHTPEGEPVGYILAYEANVLAVIDEEEANLDLEDQQVIYISDLAVLPAHQHDGYGEKAFKGMLRLAERKQKPLLFHARDNTSWAAIESKVAELEVRGFSVEDLAHHSDYFGPGKGAHLVRITKK
ncbi:MAG TPA: GNAT family N-acetyltransferase [Candidatus Saccharimonadales bacterium]|nr:GNAT family N-acetyltransferase [Candidatus Saccharimonadales bacterium]